MASDVPATVTIERTYLQTLLRRAQYNSVDGDSFVHISQAEYDGLVDVARQHANLKRNLMRGGVPEATLALLTKDDAAPGSATGLASTHMSDTDGGGATLHTRTTASLATPSQADTARGTGTSPPSRHNGFSSNYFHSGGGAVAGPRHSPHMDVDGFSEDTGGGGAAHGNSHPGAGGGGAGSRPQFERMAQRTLLLSGLDPATTHADVTRAVRGGMLLDVFLRTADRSAAVSFLRAADAKAWLDHVRRHDLYIRNKRVEVKWSERQFVLPGHVANKIGIGATRNLVVRRCDARHTARSVAEDLEHIHNLVVVRVEFLNSSCFISTNSVHNAMFARTCMMSRAKYKGSKIEWDADECAQPIEKPFAAPRQQPPRGASLQLSRPSAPQQRRSAAAAAAVVNRFQLLNLDPDGDEDKNEDSSSSSSTEDGEAVGRDVVPAAAAGEIGIAVR